MQTSALLTCLLTFAQVNLDEVQKTLVPFQAVKVSLADCTKDEVNAPFYRYIWTQKPEDKPVVDFVINLSMNRNSGTLVQTTTLPNNVLKLDLRKLCSTKEDLEDLIKVWNELAEEEPYFLAKTNSFINIKSILVSDTIVFNGSKVLGTLPVHSEITVEEEIKHDGILWCKIKYNGGFGAIAKSSIKVIEAKTQKIFGRHIGQEANVLFLLTSSICPIVRSDYFIKKSVTTLDKGLYYKFKGIKKSPDKKVSDLDFFLKSFAGVTEKEVGKFRSDKKRITTESKVTGGPRSVVFFTGIQAKADICQGIVSITKDLAEENRDVKADPIRNVLESKWDASEVILESKTGLPIYSLFDGNDNLQNEAPSSIVTDDTIRAGKRARLQPAISCIRCHNKKEGEEGWKDIDLEINDKLGAGLDIFGEKKDKIPNFDTIDRQVGLLSGDIKKLIMRGRADYSDAIVRLSPKGALPLTVTEINKSVGNIHDAYYYDLVTPVKACEEIGFIAKNELEAVEILKTVIPRLPPDELGISPEDPIVEVLKNNIGVQRYQWEQVYGDVSYRVITYLLKDKKGN